MRLGKLSAAPAADRLRTMQATTPASDLIVAAVATGYRKTSRRSETAALEGVRAFTILKTSLHLNQQYDHMS